MSGLPKPPPLPDSPVDSGRLDYSRTSDVRGAPSGGGGSRRAFQDPSHPVPRTTFYADADQPPAAPAFSANSPMRRVISTSQRSDDAPTDSRRTLVSLKPKTTERPSTPSGSVSSRIAAIAARTSTTPSSARPSVTSQPESNASVDAGASRFSGPGHVGPTRDFVAENVFISDVLFSWTGVQRTRLLQYDDVQHCYLPDGLSERQQHIFDRVGNVGALMRQLESLVETHSLSFLQQSLKGSIKKQLVECANFVASLREHADTITVAKLLIAHQKIEPKLSRLHRLLLETENTKGGDLATKLQPLLHQGSRRMSAMLSEIYIEAVHPLLHMTVQWITTGDVPDPYLEFFISVSETERDMDDSFWSKKYSLRFDMLPINFQSPEGFAEKILLVGKNINFIRRCCRAKDWRMDTSIRDDAQRSNFDNVGAVVEEALRFTNSAVLKVVHNQFKLKDTMTLLHQFMLVSNAGFFEILIARLESILSRPASKVQQSLVRDQVHSAIHESAPYFIGMDLDMINTIVAHVENKSDVDGWEAFVLSFPIASPLNNIFDRGALYVYRTLFRMHFKVKRAEVSLKLAWRQSVNLDRTIVRMRRDEQDTLAFRDVAQIAYRVGLELTHFVNNLRSYLVTEVTETAWTKLVDAISGCTSFDELRQAHHQYLEQLKLYTLLHSECAAVKNSVDVILRLTRRYCSAQSMLCALVERNHGDVFAIKEEYQNIADEYHREITMLMTTLEEQHMNFDFLNFLLLRLNFNNFYHDTHENVANTEF